MPYLRKALCARLFAGALTLTFFIYLFVNIAMVSGLLPVVGVPLPLVSWRHVNHYPDGQFRDNHVHAHTQSVVGLSVNNARSVKRKDNMSKQVLRSALVLMALLSTAFASIANAESYLQRDDIDAYINELVQQHDFSRAELEEVFAAAQRRQDIIDLISRPAERRLNWQEYSKIFLDEQRIAGGVEFWQQNKETLERAERQYGVPPEVIVAIIGVETRYGRVTGGHRVVDALTTLGLTIRLGRNSSARN